MSRPNYLNCPMTPEIINHIRQEQERYDKNPKLYEQQKKEEQELYLQEQEEMISQMKQEQERQAEESKNL